MMSTRTQGRNGNIQDTHLKVVKKKCFIALQNRELYTAVGCYGKQVHQCEETVSH